MYALDSPQLGHTIIDCAWSNMVLVLHAVQIQSDSSWPRIAAFFFGCDSFKYDGSCSTSAMYLQKSSLFEDVAVTVKPNVSRCDLCAVLV